MDNLSTELIAALHFLLLGFISAWIFHALTSYPKQSQFLVPTLLRGNAERI